MKRHTVLLLVGAIAASSLTAQSLDPKKPAPLQPGSNTGTTDNFTGAHYFYFIGEPGDIEVRALFRSTFTLEFASGTQGTWRLFDQAERIYTVVFGNQRLSLKFIPARGLVETNNPSMTVFQRVR